MLTPFRLGVVSFLLSALTAVGSLGQEPKGEPAKPKPPTAAAIAATQKTIQGQFAKDYLAARKSAAERAALSEKLFKLGQETSDDLDARYVLYLEARDLGCQAGNWALATQALEAIAGEYQVDGLRQREAALQLMVKSAIPKEAADEAARIALSSLAEALVADRIDEARVFISIGLTAAGKAQNTVLASHFRKHDQEMKNVPRDFERMKAAREVLKAKPEDAAANLEFGRYVAFRRGDWKSALPHLAKGGAGDLATAAHKDLENPEEPKKRQEVGDLWWALAGKETGWAQAALRGRAADWYRQAAGQAKGLTLAVLSDRIKASAEPPTPFRAGDLPAPSFAGAARQFKGHVGVVTSVYLTPDGKSLYSGGQDRTIRSWDLATGKQLSSLDAGAPVLSVAISPAQSFLAAVCKDRLRVWDMSSMEIVAGPLEPVAVSFWGDPHVLFSLKADGSFENRDFFKREMSMGRAFPVRGARIVGAYGVPTFVSLGQDVRLFYSTFVGNMGAGKKVDVPDAVCAAFSADARWALFAGNDKTLRRVDCETLQVTVVASALPEVPRALTISGDGQRVLVAGAKSVAVWDTDPFRSVVRLTQPAGVRDAAFTRDGRSAITAGEDGVIRIWTLPPPRR
jgi:hypothetical protein